MEYERKGREGVWRERSVRERGGRGMKCERRGGKECERRGGNVVCTSPEFYEYPMPIYSVTMVTLTLPSPREPSNSAGSPRSVVDGPHTWALFAWFERVPWYKKNLNDNKVYLLYTHTSRIHMHTHTHTHTCTSHIHTCTHTMHTRVHTCTHTHITHSHCTHTHNTVMCTHT